MVYRTPSGRRWSASPCRFHRAGTCVLMQPCGADTYSGGGVRAMHVAAERLNKPGGDKTWRVEGGSDERPE